MLLLMSHLTSPQVLFAKSLSKVIDLVPRNIDKEGGRAKDSPVVTSGLQVLFTSSLWREGFPAVTCVQCGPLALMGLLFCLVLGLLDVGVLY